MWQGIVFAEGSTRRFEGGIVCNGFLSISLFVVDCVSSVAHLSLAPSRLDGCAGGQLADMSKRCASMDLVEVLKEA